MDAPSNYVSCCRLELPVDTYTDDVVGARVDFFTVIAVAGSIALFGIVFIDAGEVAYVEAKLLSEFDGGTQAYGP